MSINVVRVVRQTLREFFEDDSPRVAAAISYFSIFPLPVVLVFIIWLLGVILGREAVQGVIEQQLQGLMGEEAARQVQTAIRNVRSWGSGGTLSVLLAAAGFTYGVSGAFLALQDALNGAWEVKPDPRQGGARRFLLKRLLSFLLVLLVAFLLLVLLGATTALSAFGELLRPLLPPWLTTALLSASNWLLSTALTFLLLAAIFRVLPDAQVEWRDVWLAAAVTALLFNAGKYLIALGVGALSPIGLFGAAGAVLILMIWINITAMIILLGAELAQVLIRARGGRIRPVRGATRTEKDTGAHGGR